ncbi:MAG: universal stress protein [Dissulfurispiraceae bacterium]|jgi:nucleotide-binding universal stress UspA family protein
MKGYRKVLIAVNKSMDVLAEGLKLACDEKCWVTVVKVIPANEGDLNLTGIKNIDAVLDNGASKAVAEINNNAKSRNALIKTRLEEGDVHKRIVEVAEEEDCDLIIMGAQKMKKGLKRFFGVNIVEKVIESAPCSVLVVGT